MIRNILTVRGTGVLIYVTSNKVDTTDTGYFVDNTIFNDNGYLELFEDVEVEESYLKNPSMYKYVSGQFIANEKYVAPPKTQEELEQEIETLKFMVADLGLQVGGGL